MTARAAKYARKFRALGLTAGEAARLVREGLAVEADRKLGRAGRWAAVRKLAARGRR